VLGTYIRTSNKEREMTSALEPLAPALATSDKSGAAGVCKSRIPHISSLARVPNSRTTRCSRSTSRLAC
jgi:hypothetical protein